MKKPFLLILSSLMLVVFSNINTNRNPNLLAKITKTYYVCNQRTHKCTKAYNYSSNAYDSPDACGRACTPRPYLVAGKGYMHGWDFYCHGNAGIQGCICKQRIDQYSKYGSSEPCQQALNQQKGIASTEGKSNAGNKKDSKKDSKKDDTTPGRYWNGYIMDRTFTGYKCVKQ